MDDEEATMPSEQGRRATAAEHQEPADPRVRPMATSAPKSFRKPVTSKTVTDHGTPSRASFTNDGDTVDCAP
ncbi:hypothetical protein [Streptomyces cinnamoneus]|uniref:hypothetical protein n=1 Tax=Streptomyces cinnamoneus TaxID=53446 RepID=UPI0037A1A2BC